MTDRTYRAILGALLLLTLTFDLDMLMYGIIAVLFFEGVTDIRIPKLMCKLRKCLHIKYGPGEYAQDTQNLNSRFSIESERMWRLIVGCMLAITFYFFEQLWFFPWFMGFAIFGAGVSGVCPVLLVIRWAGFR